MRKNTTTTPIGQKTVKGRGPEYDDNQTIPVLIVRGRQVPITLIEHDGPVEWQDLVGRGDEAVCDPGYEVVLYRDRNGAILCLARGPKQSKLRCPKPDRTGISRQWMYRYSIFYIYPGAREDERLIRHEEKTPLGIGRLITTNTNIRRWPNNSNNGCGSYFPPELNHTIEEADPATLLLFELQWGKRRGDGQ